MKILISGTGGTIGREVLPVLGAAGHRVTALVRRPPVAGSDEVQWSPQGAPNPDLVAGYDAVIHLAGENIGSRWTTARKQAIVRSRVEGTGMLATSMAQAARRPQVLISASAIGYYGDRGDEVLTENSAAGTGFLASLCQQWEAATVAASGAGIRVVLLRIGFVLSATGGGLPRLVTPMRLGMGGPAGSGQQWMSWIAVGELAGIVAHALEDTSLQGVFNAVAPSPVRNREFVGTLARVLHRPAVFPLPAFMVRAMLGEMGEEVVLASQRVQPERLLASGYKFQWPELEGALRHTLL